jgi:hypothetical protein
MIIYYISIISVILSYYLINIFCKMSSTATLDGKNRNPKVIDISRNKKDKENELMRS